MRAPRINRHLAHLKVNFEMESISEKRLLHGVVLLCPGGDCHVAPDYFKFGGGLAGDGEFAPVDPIRATDNLRGGEVARATGIGAADEFADGVFGDECSRTTQQGLIEELDGGDLVGGQRRCGMEDSDNGIGGLSRSGDGESR